MSKIEDHCCSFHSFQSMTGQVTTQPSKQIWLPLRDSHCKHPPQRIISQAFLLPCKTKYEWGKPSGQIPLLPPHREVHLRNISFHSAHLLGCAYCPVNLGKCQRNREALAKNSLKISIYHNDIHNGSVVKNLSASVGDAGEIGLILGLGRSPGEVNGNTLQYSSLGNSKGRGAPWTHGVMGSQKVRHDLATEYICIYIPHAASRRWKQI